MFLEYEIIHFDKIDSTHNYAMRRGPDLKDGTVILTDFQTAGRGQFNRKWVSQHGKGLLFSMILKPHDIKEEPSLLTAVAAQAIVDALSEFGIKSTIKWPNDVLTGGRKIAGVLAEAILRGKLLDYVVVSAGININQEEADLAAVDRPATSVLIESKRSLSPREVLNRFIDHFDKRYADFLERGFIAIGSLKFL